MRETWEEAGATVEVISPFAQLDIPLIGQVNYKYNNIPSFDFFIIHIIVLNMTLLILEQTYVIFLAKLKNLHFAPGPESLECRLFALDEIPFDSLAFSSIYVTLNLVRIWTKKNLILSSLYSLNFYICLFLLFVGSTWKI